MPSMSKKVLCITAGSLYRTVALPFERRMSSHITERPRIPQIVSYINQNSIKFRTLPEVPNHPFYTIAAPHRTPTFIFFESQTQISSKHLYFDIWL